jgi:predicted P-loop ATPase/GTPase
MISYSLVMCVCVLSFFNLVQVGLIAINDGLILRSQISRIFKRYFYGKTYYVDLLDLFNEVTHYIQKSTLYKINMVSPLFLQEHDLITTHLGRV